MSVGALLGRRIRELRRGVGITQAELGERCQMAASEISKLENARRVPTLDTLERLAAALGVGVVDLFSAHPPARVRDELFDSIVDRLRGQPEEVLRRVDAVVEALLKAP